MEQNGIKVNLDNAGSKTRLMYIYVYIYIYIYIHNKIEIQALRTFRTACKMQQKNEKQF